MGTTFGVASIYACSYEIKFRVFVGRAARGVHDHVIGVGNDLYGVYPNP